MLHHVDVHVRDLATSALFAALAERIGYCLLETAPDFVGFETAARGRPRIGFILDPGHAAGSMRLAFAVKTRGFVDEIAAIARRRGARAIEGPGLHPEYGDYYAVFFEDAEGNKYEVLADPQGT